MPQTAIAARRIKAVGSFTELVAGVLEVVAAGTTTLTLLQFSTIEGVVASSDTSDLVGVATDVSGNVITFDHETSTQRIAYIAWGLGAN